MPAKKRPVPIKKTPRKTLRNEKDIARKQAMKYVLSKIPYSQKGLTGIDLNFNPDIVKEIMN